MNGGHDLGGMHGLGPINPDPETTEIKFHADWERSSFSVTIAAAMLGRWNIDVSRHSRERQHPIDYLKNTYYENWFAGTRTMLIETGLITEEELERGKPLSPIPDADKLKVPNVEEALNQVKAGGPADMDTPIEPAFAIGTQVHVKNFHPIGHTRAPRYTRGHVGEIARYHGVHIFPDTHTVDFVEGFPLYSVKFATEELWGPDGEPGGFVFADLWEPYLEKVE